MTEYKVISASSDAMLNRLLEANAVERWRPISESFRVTFVNGGSLQPALYSVMLCRTKQAPPSAETENVPA